MMFDISPLLTGVGKRNICGDIVVETAAYVSKPYTTSDTQFSQTPVNQNKCRSGALYTPTFFFYA